MHCRIKRVLNLYSHTAKFTPYNQLSGQQMLSGTQIISTSHGMTGRNFFEQQVFQTKHLSLWFMWIINYILFVQITMYAYTHMVILLISYNIHWYILKFQIFTEIIVKDTGNLSKKNATHIHLTNSVGNKYSPRNSPIYFY
jgi:hypothetical protein